MNILELFFPGAIQYLKRDIWRVRLEEVPPSRAFLIRKLKILIIAVIEFGRDKCPLRSSALTYYTALSIVPVVALLFAIGKGFGFQNVLESRLLDQIPEHEAVLLQVVNFAHRLLDTARGGVIAGIGIIILLWAVIKVIGNIELSFNDIWNIKKSRSLVRKFTDYLSMTIIAPVLILLSSSATVFVTTRVSGIAERWEIEKIVGPLMILTTKLSPYIIIWILFMLVYIILPNTRVKLHAGFFAAIVAGTTFQITQMLYIKFQVGVAKYNAIYGGFAALPLFLIWLQLSWMIVLFGAEISFAIQNLDYYEPESASLKINLRNRRILALLLAHKVVKDFADGSPPMSADELSDHLGIPAAFVLKVMPEFVECGLFSLVEKGRDGEEAYQPASSIDHYTVKFVIDHMEKCGPEDVPAAPGPDLERIAAAFDRLEEAIEGSEANRLLKDI